MSTISEEIIQNLSDLPLEPVRWIRLNNPPFRKLMAALKMAVCYRETALQ